MMEQTKKPFSKEEVLAVLEQLMSEMGTMDKLDMPEESMGHENSENVDFEAKEDKGIVSDLADKKDIADDLKTEGKAPSLVVAIGDSPEEDDMDPYMKHRTKGQMYK